MRRCSKGLERNTFEDRSRTWKIRKFLLNIHFFIHWATFFLPICGLYGTNVYNNVKAHKRPNDLTLWTRCCYLTDSWPLLTNGHHRFLQIPEYFTRYSSLMNFWTLLFQFKLTYRLFSVNVCIDGEDIDKIALLMVMLVLKIIHNI